MAYMTEPFAPAALFKKAQLFVNRSFEAVAAGQFDAAALWASLALELLAKWALAMINPCLIADPSDDGKSLLTAAGVSKNLAEFKTIPAKAAYSRCGRAFPHFNEREANRVSGNRNDDVHSGAVPFANLDEDRWWRRYWREVAVLLAAHQLSLQDLVGAANLPIAEGHVLRNSETVSLVVTAQIDRARARWENRPQGTDRLGTYLIGPEYEARETCPACGNSGTLFGDSVEDEEEFYPVSPDDIFNPYALLTVAADLFGCPYCGLHLDGADYVVAAELPESFQVEVEREDAWDDYQNE